MAASVGRLTVQIINIVELYARQKVVFYIIDQPFDFSLRLWSAYLRDKPHFCSEVLKPTVSERLSGCPPINHSFHIVGENRFRHTAKEFRGMDDTPQQTVEITVLCELHILHSGTA